jgi:hypothetical protein
MGHDWYDVLRNAAFLAGAAFALRELLIIVVTVWSLGADDRGRDHALKLLKVLRVQIRRPPSEPPPPPELPAREPPPELPPGPKDPPQAGPGG